MFGWNRKFLMKKLAYCKLYADTVKYLKPIQIIYRVKHSFVKSKPQEIKKVPEYFSKMKFVIPELDMDSAFWSRFDEKKLIGNEIVLVGEAETLQQGVWDYEEHSPLWNYNLHYFEYAIVLAAQYRSSGQESYKEKVLEWISDWCQCVKSGVGWHSYPISLRICNWFIIYELLNEKPSQTVYNNIYSQYRYLIKNQEKHLLGNHYFENLKTIVICSIYFGEEKVFKRYWKDFLQEIEEEVLSDGVHFERSLMYHKIIMEDIMRVAKALESSGRETEKTLLLSWLNKMAIALFSLEKGMGKTPHFNDAADGVAKDTDSLLKALNEWGIVPEERNSFPSAGYYKLYGENTALLFDCGELGPRYMTGHGHCDALSFELSIKGEPILVNSGTYQYQGKLRNYFRCTRANNTLIIDNCEQSEIWGEHRTGRRIRCVKGFRGDNFVGGKYKGYFHQRFFIHTDVNQWVIEDKIKGPEKATVSAFFHAAPGFTWFCDNKLNFVLSNKKTNKNVLMLQIHETDAYVHVRNELNYYSSKFGCLEKSEVLAVNYKADSKEIRSKILLSVI